MTRAGVRGNKLSSVMFHLPEFSKTTKLNGHSPSVVKIGERLKMVENKWYAHFSFENSVWKFGTTFQKILSSLEIFLAGQTKVVPLFIY